MKTYKVFFHTGDTFPYICFSANKYVDVSGLRRPLAERASRFEIIGHDGIILSSVEVYGDHTVVEN